MTRKQKLVLAAMAAVVVLAAYIYLTQPIVCCACGCKNPDGSYCHSSKTSGSEARGCEKICADVCKKAGCGLEQAFKMYDGKCAGYW